MKKDESDEARSGGSLPRFRRLSLRKNFSWTLVGNVYYAGCQWAMLMLIAKIGNPDMVGRFALGLAIGAPVVMFSNLSLRLVLATDAGEIYQFRTYLALRLVTAPVALLVIAGIALSAGYPLETALTVIVIGVFKALAAVSEIYYGLFQWHERLDRISKSMIIKGSLSLILLGTGVYITYSVFWGVVGLVLAAAFTLITYDLGSAHFIIRSATSGKEMDVRTALKPEWRTSLLQRLALFAFPLGIMALLQSLNMNIPRYLIERQIGEYGLGIFAALTYVMVAGTTIVRALGQSASPVMAKHYVSGRLRSFFRLVALMVAAGTVIGLLGVGIAAAAGRWILQILYTPEYAAYTALFVSIMFASLFLYIAQFLDYCTTVVRMFRAQMILAFLVSGITFAVCIWLLPRAGLLGASQALLWGGVAKVVGNLAILGYAAQKSGRSPAPLASPVFEET